MRSRARPSGRNRLSRSRLAPAGPTRSPVPTRGVRRPGRGASHFTVLVAVLPLVFGCSEKGPHAPRLDAGELAPSFQRFTSDGGPSVRVQANSQVEFKWKTDVGWEGKVEVFDNPDGAGSPVLTKRSVDEAGDPLAATEHVVTVSVSAPLAEDTGYFFRITATDPGSSIGDIVTPTPLPPFFTGEQELFDVTVSSITNESATISWDANVTGFGSVVYGTEALDQGPVEDTDNVTAHAIQLTGLSPGTTYEFQAGNMHAIDGDVLASETGEFTTTDVAFQLAQPRAEPRRIPVDGVSTVRIRVQNQGDPVPGTTVGFAIDPNSQGDGRLSSAQATTDSNGVATVELTATRRGNVNVNVTSSDAQNSPLTIPVVVR